MDGIEEIKLLTEIKETLKANNAVLAEMSRILSEDRKMMWKVIALTIIGTFAIIGVKIAFP